MIVGFFIAGAVCGYYGLLDISRLNFDMSYYALAILIICVGIGIGHDVTNLKRDLKELGSRMLLLPIATILGTLAGCLAVSFLLTQRSVTDILAVGSGFGYYTIEYIHNRIQRGRARHCRSSHQHYEGNTDFAWRTSALQDIRSAGSNLIGRSHIHGHYIANHNVGFRT